MTNYVLNFDWMALVLVVITCVLVARDRAFSKVIRIEFKLALLFSLIISLVSQYLSLLGLKRGDSLYRVAIVLEVILRPAVIILLFIIFRKIKRDIKDYLFVAAMGMIFIMAVLSEAFLDTPNVVNNTMCVIVVVYYYFCVVQTYKKDNLTRLPIRHNLNYDMEDNSDKSYDVVLIDVDNFKLINDKYGHNKGDEALIKVVKAVKDCLPKGCRLYRYGGDEFVIISTKVSRTELETALEKGNQSLEKDNLHFSFGIAVHNPGESKEVALTLADEKMYDNKNELKGDGVWDNLTGLYNYRGLLDEIERRRGKAKKRDKMLCMVAVDIDRLNSVNMAYGYIEGNYVIKSVATIIDAVVADKGVVGHLSSDEFVAVIEVNDENDERIMNFIHQINKAVSDSMFWDDKEYTVNLHVGQYLVDKDNTSSTEELVNDVLYVKQEIKDNKHKQEALDADKDYNAQDEALVLDILDNNKLQYAFQPIVSAKDGEIVAYETLMRSNTETVVSPLTILKYAERNHRSYDVERYTYFNVFNLLSQENFFPENARIFINSIPGHILNDDDYETLKSRFGNWMPRMVVEITEQREMEEDALSTINMRRDKDGYSLAIDDYGSGYSNTNSLLRYMPSIIKLDRLLITGIERNAKKQFFVNSIVSFARENDMLTLAEGVETERELKTVIRLGVDYIQGYYTAKPSLEIVREIPEDVKKLIIEENIKAGSSARMVYTVADSCEISSVRLAMEDYTKILVSAEYTTIVGNEEYTADMVIKIKDGANCHVTLKNVKLNSVDDEPCIEVGEGASLTLNLEGNNRLNSKGIHVPEGSSLTVIGSGNLEIFAKGHECYAIGSDTESSFGEISLGSTGDVRLTVDGENCVVVGGGIAGEKPSILARSGNFFVDVAGVNAVGFGCYKGQIPIVFNDSNMQVDFRVNKGVVIGILEGIQDIHITNFYVLINGSGTAVCGIGSINETSGSIELKSGCYRVKLNGQKIHLLGCSEGELSINSSHVKFEMTGEGDNVIGFGSFNDAGHLSVDESSMDLVINASNPKVFGIVEEETGFKGAITEAKVNGVVWVVGEGKE